MQIRNKRASQPVHLRAQPMSVLFCCLQPSPVITLEYFNKYSSVLAIFPHACLKTKKKNGCPTPPQGAALWVRLTRDTKGATNLHSPRAQALCYCKVCSRTRISRGWLSPSFHVQRYPRKCCCDPSKGMVAMSSISNSNPAWNPLLPPHPSVGFPVGPTHQVKPPQLLSSTCRLLLPNIWKVRAALRKLGSLLGKVGREKRMWAWEACVQG